MDILDSIISDSPVLNTNSTFGAGNKVGNLFPTITQPYRIALIGEAPGRDEELQGRPFVGMSGKMLTQMLGKANIIRDACFIGNICQLRPPNNDISTFSFDGEEIQSGLDQLEKDLRIFKPNIVLLLGKIALRAAKGEILSIDSWRGSFFMGSGIFEGIKCIASFHPAFCLRAYEATPLLMFDIIKCRKEAESPILVLPQRNIEINLKAYEIIQRLQSISEYHTKIALDIEGGINSWSCISIATSPTNVFIIPLSQNYWSVEDESSILRELSKVLANPNIGKILQNSLYDRFVLQYSYNLVIVGTVDDTMLKSWELYCELEKGLGFLCSLYTKEPYYKGDRKSDSMETFWQYCCKDSAVTYEISNSIEKLLNPQQKSHYQFNVELLNCLLYMELRGIKYDTKLARSRLREVNNHIYNLQYKLDRLAQVGFMGNEPRNEILQKVREVLCYKKDPTKPKKGNEEAVSEAVRILQKSTNLEPAEIGQLNILVECSMNTKSKIYKEFLYDKLKLPKQYKRNPLTKAESLTTDYEALLKIQQKQPHEAVELGIYIGELRSRSQMLEIYADNDGRIRCGLNVVGQVTGRISSYTSPTGSGYNLTTIPDNWPYPDGHPLRQGMRDLFISDPGYEFFQCDLKGADGWTIGAHIKRLGNSCMIDDLLFGIKPAARICYMLRHGNSSLHHKPREEVKELLKEVKKDDWDYFACKVGIWGICYLMGPDLLAAQIREESQGKVLLSRKQVSDFRDAVFMAYQPQLWHQASQRYIDKVGTPTLQSASGNVRKFFGRKQNILGEYLASEPQNNTTYALKLAMQKLWRDTENRLLSESNFNGKRELDEITSGNLPKNVPQQQATKLRIEPFLPVHDALLGQFKTTDTNWAKAKIKTYFNNQITIAGIPIIIPFEGNHGPSWGNLPNPI